MCSGGKDAYSQCTDWDAASGRKPVRGFIQMNASRCDASEWVQCRTSSLLQMIESPGPSGPLFQILTKETTMLKKMSVALLAASILAAPALAAGSAKTTGIANPTQTASTPANSGAAKTAVVKSTSGSRHLRKVARHHRVNHRHVAHRHHNKVSTMHASAKSHAHAKTRLGLHKTGHKVGFNKVRKTGTKLSFKRATPATHRG
jgi:hypothetical protein